MSSLARTKLILGTADRETATWCSDFIGHTQVRDMEEGYTYGFNNARDAVSLTSRKHIEPLLLPDQLMNLPRLKGYLKFPDGFAAAQVSLTPVDRPRRADGFIRRAIDPVALQPFDQASEVTESGVQGATSTGEEHPSDNVKPLYPGVRQTGGSPNTTRCCKSYLHGRESLAIDVNVPPLGRLGRVAVAAARSWHI